MPIMIDVLHSTYATLLKEGGLQALVERLPCPFRPAGVREAVFG